MVHAVEWEIHTITVGNCHCQTEWKSGIGATTNVEWNGSYFADNTDLT